MIINFANLGGGGGGGTSDYSQLTNKPQINGHVLQGNQSSSDLGITSEALEPVSSIPSGASAGDVYAVNKSQELSYGWENTTGSTLVFNRSLNPNTGHTDMTEVLIGYLVDENDPSYQRELKFWYNFNEGKYWGTFFGDAGFELQPGYTQYCENYWSNVNVLFDYTDVNKMVIKLTDGNGDPYTGASITSGISPMTSVTSDNKVVQIKGYGETAHWEFYNKYSSDRYGQIMFIMSYDYEFPAVDTIIGIWHYYDLYYRLRSTGNNIALDASTDSGSTWNTVCANFPYSENFTRNYTLIGQSTGREMPFSVEYKTGETNYYVCFNSEKYCWIDDCQNVSGITSTDLIKKGADYATSLTNLPQINGVELKGNKTTADLGIAVNGLTNPDADPQTLIPTDGTDIAGKRGGFVIYGWDGKSDMTFSAEASRATGSWGPYSFNTPYFSGGTWYGLSDMRSSEVKFRVLPGNVIYLYGRKEQQSWGQPVYQFTGNISGSVGDLKMFYIDDVKQGSEAEVRIFRTPKVQHCGFSLADFRGDGTITFSANTGDVIALDIASSEITGATFNGDSFSEGQEMTLKSGLDYFCYHGTQGYLVICDGDYNYQGNEAFVDYFTDVDVPLNVSDEPIVTVYFNEKYVYDDGAYQWNGCLWDKLIKENELPAPAAGGVQTHWVPYTDSQTYAMEGKCSYVRGDIVSGGDYYCNVGQIDGEQKALWASISNGAITGVGGQLYSNEINGHYYITVKDSSENTYGAQCWVDNGKLYWQVYGTTIVHLDNNELGANWEAGFIY